MISATFLEEKIDINSNITKTEDIFNKISSIRNLKKEDLLLEFNSIYISSICTFALADIGFSFDDTLNITFNNTAQAYFKILQYNYSFHQEIDMCTNVFSIKKELANSFFTVPQNIIIKSKNHALSDDTLLFNETDKNFEVEVEQGYTLYYTFYGQFQFICMPNDSTLKDLQNALFIYARDTNSTIFKQFSPVLPEENNEKTLLELSKNINIFEFNEYQSKKNNFKITVKIDNYDINCSIDIEIPYGTCVYSITCYLERITGIDRKLFTAYDQDNAKIEKNTILDPKVNSFINFTIYGSLRVNINNEIKEISYLTRICDIKTKYDFNNHNFGIIINNQFACSKDSHDNTFLLEFLTNTTTEVKIAKSKHSCHEKTFTKTSKFGSQKSSHFLIPDDMSPDQISIKYLGNNYDSIEAQNDGNNIIKYWTPKSRTVHFNFIDERNQKWPYEFLIQNEKPRVFDLLLTLYDYRTLPLPYKNLKYCAEFEKESLKSGTWLSSILYDNTNRITIKEIKGLEEEEILLIIWPENIEKKLKLNHNITVQEILNQNGLQDHSLFHDYKLLSPTDRPYICNNKDSILTANKLIHKNTFSISNGPLNITISLKSDEYAILPYYIKSMFGEDNIKFYLRIGDRKYELPSDFHAGSLPNNPQIIIDYKTNQVKEILINHMKTRLLPVSTYYFLKILGNNEKIMKALDFYYYSKKSLCLSFYGVKLSTEKSLSEYKITSKMPLSIDYTENSFQISVSTPNKIYSKNYRFCNNETIKDLKDHLKEQFRLKDPINITLPDGSTIPDKSYLHEDMQIQFSTKKITVKFQSNQQEKEYTFDGVDKVSKVNDFIDKLENQGIQSIFYLFTYNKEENCYIKADPKKRLNEFSSDLFAHKILPSFYLTGYQMRFDEKLFISEQNTLGWFKKEFIAKQAKTLPEKLVIIKDQCEVDESTLMKDLYKGTLMEIKFKEFDTKRKTNKPKNVKRKIKLIKPKVVPVDTESPRSNKRNKTKPKNKKGLNNETATDDDDNKKSIETKKKSNDVFAKTLRKTKKKNATNENELVIPSNMDQFNISLRKKKNKDKNKSSDDEKTDSPKNKMKRNFNEKSETEEDHNKNDEKTKEDKTILQSYSDDDNDEEISRKTNKNENDVDNDDDKSEEDKDEISPENDHFEQNHTDFEIEEEEDEDEEPVTNDEIVCQFQISKNPPFTLTMKNTDTIEDAKIKLSKREGVADLNCISIVFAGKKLKKNLSLKSLKLQENDILQVFIFTPQTILLKSAKCFSIHGKQEFEYDSEYEEEEESDI